MFLKVARLLYIVLCKMFAGIICISVITKCLFSKAEIFTSFALLCRFERKRKRDASPSCHTPKPAKRNPDVDDHIATPNINTTDEPSVEEPNTTGMHLCLFLVAV